MIRPTRSGPWVAVQWLGWAALLLAVSASTIRAADVEPTGRPEPSSAAAPPSRSAETSSPSADVSGSTGWIDRVLLLSDEIEQGRATSKRADALYGALAPELWSHQGAVDAALRERSPDALDQRARLSEMYDARIRLLDLVSPSLRRRLMDGGSDGVQEIEREFEHARLALRFQTVAVPRGLWEIVEDLRDSPFDEIWRVFQLFFGVMVFRVWRRWAKTGLVDARKNVLAIRPRTDMQLHVARLLWSMNRFRGPLEWLALLFFVSALLDAPDLAEVGSLVWVILLWTLLTRFGFLLVDALASRRAGLARSHVSKLRLRSLRLLAGWVLLTGLGLDLTSRYVGEGVIHAWATRLFLALLVPIGLLLLQWWRLEILRRVKEDTEFSAMARRIGRREKGLASYLNAIAGAVYIVGAEMRQGFIRIASQFEMGRKLVATLLRLELEREAPQQGGAEQPIPEELRLRILTPDETIIEGPYREHIESIKARALEERGTTIALLAERGGGLGTFLRILEQDIGESMRIVDCPPGGIGEFEEALAQAFGIASGEDLESALPLRLDAEGVRIVAIDNYHRLARPKRGGIAGLLRLSEIANAAGKDIVWIVTLTRASWPYISRLLGDRAIRSETMELPAWSESQLEELFDARCKKAEIEPDYRRLVFPRQFDDGERDTLEDRNRFGFRRVLWEMSDGNPEVAIRLFADSLRQLPSGKIIVRLPQPASTTTLGASNRTTLLVLKVLFETEMATLDDLHECIREPREALEGSIAHGIQQGWIEEVYEYYQVTWSAYRTVKRALVRQGLIGR